MRTFPNSIWHCFGGHSIHYIKAASSVFVAGYYSLQSATFFIFSVSINPPNHTKKHLIKLIYLYYLLEGQIILLKVRAEIISKKAFRKRNYENSNLYH